MLTLKEFIKETLTEITDGLMEFAESKSETGANPNPSYFGKIPDPSYGFLIGAQNKEKGRYDMIMPVDFDVAVSAEDSSSKSGGGSIRVVSFLAGEGKIESETSVGSVSRVKFRVPFRLPDTGD
jgi:hypothetical protein